MIIDTHNEEMFYLYIYLQQQYKFRLYCVFSTNQEDSTVLVNKLLEGSDFKAFILKCQENLDHKLNLHSFLLKPVQRILKYHILLKVSTIIFRNNSLTLFEYAQEVCYSFYQLFCLNVSQYGWLVSLTAACVLVGLHVCCQQ